MNAYLLTVYLHVVVGVVLTGYALFWAVMAVTLRADRRGLDPEGTLALIGASRWPPVKLPNAVRVPVIWLGWLFVAFMVASGIVLIRQRGITMAELTAASFWTQRAGVALGVKLVLLVIFVVQHMRLARRPSRGAAVCAALLAFSIVCVSALLV
ncbi:MAG TPA: hypothetical protein VFK13_10780 [Gemmatimonadaceae bacterium]|nr:hypothetical protein [Gemmatimonadaceae bacterium]